MFLKVKRTKAIIDRAFENHSPDTVLEDRFVDAIAKEVTDLCNEEPRGYPWTIYGGLIMGALAFWFISSAILVGFFIQALVVGPWFMIYWFLLAAVVIFTVIGSVCGYWLFVRDEK